ncbi:MAG: response regulator [Desulfuromonadales bacterium]|jgi:putative two-component system response regulator|nr:response regulator [Desulfuromonadales bacterium]
MSNKARILLIDDHQTVFRLIEAIVRIKGYTLLYAESGQQGIVMARKEQPDLILLDVMMPDIDGFKVCQYLKENEDTKTIPVMFLTARGADGDLEAGRKAGADGFMTKPFQTIEVLKQIEQLLAARQA